MSLKRRIRQELTIDSGRSEAIHLNGGRPIAVWAKVLPAPGTTEFTIEAPIDGDDLSRDENWKPVLDDAANIIVIALAYDNIYTFNSSKWDHLPAKIRLVTTSDETRHVLTIVYNRPVNYVALGRNIGSDFEEINEGGAILDTGSADLWL